MSENEIPEDECVIVADGSIPYGFADLYRKGMFVGRYDNRTDDLPENILWDTIRVHPRHEKELLAAMESVH